MLCRLNDWKGVGSQPLGWGLKVQSIPRLTAGVPRHGPLQSKSLTRDDAAAAVGSKGMSK
jgi:hypothetical protein